MKRTIEIVFSTTGEASIEGVRFRGPACEKATRFLEEALGVVATKIKKPEYHVQNVDKSQQKVGL